MSELKRLPSRSKLLLVIIISFLLIATTFVGAFQFVDDEEYSSDIEEKEDDLKDVGFDLREGEEEPDGDGTEDDPYLITSLEELNWVRNDLDAYYELQNDIDASDTKDWNDEAGWEPIGSFTGVFDGQGYTINELFIDRGTTDNIGLFGDIGEDGIIMNIGIVDVDMVGREFVGGLVGENFGTVSNSFATGEITGTDDYVGILLGINDGGSVQRSFTNGSVTGEDRVGGLTGANYPGSMITDTYSNGDVTGGQWVGGLVGVNHEGTVYGSYATGSVEGGTDVGGLVGLNYMASVENSYYPDDQDASAGTALNRDDMKGASADSEDGMQEFNFDGIWDTVEETDIYASEDSYPVLQDLDLISQLEARSVLVENTELIVNIDGEGDTDPEPGTHTFEWNEEVTIETIPEEGYVFNNWLGDYPYFEKYEDEITITMDSNKEITAYFIEEEKRKRVVESQKGWEHETEEHDEVIVIEEGVLKLIEPPEILEVDHEVGVYEAGIGWLLDKEVGYHEIAYDTSSHTDWDDYQWILDSTDPEFEASDQLTDFPQFHLEGLTSSTDYYYRVRSHALEDEVYSTSDEHEFRTLAAGGCLYGHGSSSTEPVDTLSEGVEGDWSSDHWYTDFEDKSLINTFQTYVEIGSGQDVEVNISVDTTGDGEINTWSDWKDLSDGENILTGEDLGLPDRYHGYAVEFKLSTEGSESPTVFNYSLEVEGVIGIYNWKDLYEVRDDLNASYALENDLHQDTAYYEEYVGTGDGWEPIGDMTHQFNGTFDGQGHAIRDLHIDREGESHLGLFGVTNNTEIKDVRLEDVDISGESYIGGLIGLDHWGSTDSVIERSYVMKGSIVGSGSTGFVGGLVGQYYGDVSDSFAIVSVTGVKNVGGLMGYTNGEVLDCYSAGSVEGTDDVGGLIGVAGPSADVISSFWDTEESNQSESAGGTGKSSSDMMSLTTYDDTSTVGLEDPWDIAEVDVWDGETWFIDDGRTYPQLTEPRDANFTVQYVSVENVVEGEQLVVEASIANTGDRSDTLDVTVSTEPTFFTDTEEDVELYGGESTLVTFTTGTETNDAGEYTATVETDDDSDEDDFIILKPAQFAVTIDEPEEDEEFVEDETVTVEYTITNTGDLTDTQDIIFRVDGHQEDIVHDLTLGDGEFYSSQFTWTAEETYGERTLSVHSDDDDDNVQIIVLEEAYFEVTIDEPEEDEEFVEDETVKVNYTVENLGDETTTQDIRFYVGSDLIETEQDVEIGGGETHSSQFTWTAEEPYGERTLSVHSDDDHDDVQITVLQDAFFQVELVAYVEDVLEGEELTVKYDVENIGEVEGTQDIVFEIICDVDGVVYSDTHDGIQLGPEENHTAEFTWQTEYNEDDVGEYTARVSSDDDYDEAEFEVFEVFELTLSAEEGGTTDPEPGSHKYKIGSEVHVQALSDGGWRFSYWTGDFPEGEEDERTISIIMDEDKGVTAHFEEIDADMTITGKHEGDRFGHSLANLTAIARTEGSDLIVGAPYANGTGRAYVFFGDEASGDIPYIELSQTNANVTLSGEGEGDLFGWSVFSAGDVNDNGHGDVVVGAPGWNGGRGRAYVYLGGEELDVSTTQSIQGSIDQDSTDSEEGTDDSTKDIDEENYSKNEDQDIEEDRSLDEGPDEGSKEADLLSTFGKNEKVPVQEFSKTDIEGHSPLASVPIEEEGWRYLYGGLDGVEHRFAPDNAVGRTTEGIWYGAMILDLSNDVGGYITDVAYYDNEDGGNWAKAHVAEDNDGAPGAWLSSSEEYTTSGAGWVELELEDHVKIEEPAEYWVVMEFHDHGDGNFPFGCVHFDQTPGDPWVEDGQYFNAESPQDPGDWIDIEDYDIGGAWALEANVSGSIETKPPTDVDLLSATLKGELFVWEDEDVYFEYRESEGNWQTTPTQTESGTFEYNIDDLDPLSMYEFRAAVDREEGTHRGDILSFVPAYLSRTTQIEEEWYEYDSMDDLTVEQDDLILGKEERDDGEYGYTGSKVDIDVSEYTQIEVEMSGAGGGGENYNNYEGGDGGYVLATLDVSEFDEITIWVGQGGDANGAGGWGLHEGGSGCGGGTGGNPGGGGGSTEIWADYGTGDETFLAAADAGGGGAYSTIWGTYHGGGGARGGDGYTSGEGVGYGGDGGSGNQAGMPGGGEVNSRYVVGSIDIVRGGGSSGGRYGDGDNGEVNINYYNHANEGERISEPLSLAPIESAGDTLIQWNETLPTDTDIEVDTAILGSEETPEEGDWDSVSSEGGIPGITEGEDLSESNLWIRQRLYTTDNLSTPRLHDLSVAFVLDSGYWIGEVDTDWEVRGNWGDGNIPDQDVDVTIPPDREYYPEVDVSVSSKSLYVEDEAFIEGRASVTILGGTIEVMEDCQIQGIVTIEGSDSVLDIGGDLTVYGDGSLEVDQGTIVLNNGEFVVQENGTLKLEGTSSHRAAITTEDQGRIDWTIAGEFDASYYLIEYPNIDGVQFTETAIISSLENGVFDYPAENGVLLNLSGVEDIPTPIYGCVFDDSDSESDVHNVRADHETQVVQFREYSGDLAEDPATADLHSDDEYDKIFWGVEHVEVEVKVVDECEPFDSALTITYQVGGGEEILFLGSGEVKDSASISWPDFGSEVTWQESRYIELILGEGDERGGEGSVRWHIEKDDELESNKTATVTEVGEKLSREYYYQFDLEVNTAGDLLTEERSTTLYYDYFHVEKDHELWDGETFQGWVNCGSVLNVTRYVDGPDDPRDVTYVCDDYEKEVTGLFLQHQFLFHAEFPPDVTITGSTDSSQFGWSVTGGADFDNSGSDDISIGDPGYDQDRGRTYTFYNDGTWEIGTELYAGFDDDIYKEGEEPGDRFGHSLGEPGTVPEEDEDIHFLVVGAPYHSSIEDDAGRVYLFEFAEWPVVYVEFESIQDNIFLGDVSIPMEQDVYWYRETVTTAEDYFTLDAGDGVRMTIELQCDHDRAFIELFYGDEEHDSNFEMSMEIIDAKTEWVKTYRGDEPTEEWCAVYQEGEDVNITAHVSSETGELGNISSAEMAVISANGTMIQDYTEMSLTGEQGEDWKRFYKEIDTSGLDEARYKAVVRAVDAEGITDGIFGETNDKMVWFRVVGS